MNLFIFFTLFIVLPFVVLYSLIKIIMGTKAHDWVAEKVAKKKWHNYYFLSSLCSFSLFIIAFGLFYFKIKDNDIDNSGMGVVVLIPPLIMTLILLIASLITRFYCYKKSKKTDNVIFVIMGLMTIPVLLFGLLWLALIVLILLG